MRAWNLLVLLSLLKSNSNGKVQGGPKTVRAEGVIRSVIRRSGYATAYRRVYHNNNTKLSSEAGSSKVSLDD
ncbi:hypothetical protein BDV18DRAFT_48261 [Aspergillus unguis]